MNREEQRRQDYSFSIRARSSEDLDGKSGWCGAAGRTWREALEGDTERSVKQVGVGFLHLKLVAAGSELVSSYLVWGTEPSSGVIARGRKEVR